jgi:hypothetical protein
MGEGGGGGEYFFVTEKMNTIVRRMRTLFCNRKMNTIVILIDVSAKIVACIYN